MVPDLGAQAWICAFCDLSDHFGNCVAGLGVATVGRLILMQCGGIPEVSATPPWKSRFYEAYVSSGHTIDTGGTAEDLFRPRKAFLKHIIAQHVPRDTNARILEVACGPGALLYFMEQAGYRNVAGVDVSEEQIAVAARWNSLSELFDGLRIFSTLRRPAPPTAYWRSISLSTCHVKRL